MAQGDYNRLTQEQFLARATEAHKGRYDYSQAIYQGKGGKVKILCPTHGVFEQLAGSHMKGLGCRKCGQLVTGRKNSISQEQFIKQAKQRHGSKYDYSKTEYRNSKTKVIITCLKHGDFKQSPLNHAHGGNGCPSCRTANLVVSTLLGKDAYLEKFAKVHGQRYGYQRLPDRFKGREKVGIICSIHGDFFKTASEHAGGAGCPKCGARLRAQNGPGWTRSAWQAKQNDRVAKLYLVRLQNGGETFFKVGITYRTPAIRLRQIPYAVTICAVYESLNAVLIYDTERLIASRFAQDKYQPRLAFEGQTECFLNIDSILCWLASLWNESVCIE